MKFLRDVAVVSCAMVVAYYTIRTIADLAENA